MPRGLLTFAGKRRRAPAPRPRDRNLIMHSNTAACDMGGAKKAIIGAVIRAPIN